MSGSSKLLVDSKLFWGMCKDKLVISTGSQPKWELECNGFLPRTYEGTVVSQHFLDIAGLWYLLRAAY